MKKMIFLVAVLFLLALASGVHAEDSDYVGGYNYSDDAYYDAYQTSQNTSAFDGGPGSTINTGVSQTYPYGDVPDVGECGPVGYYDEDGNYHSY